MDILCLDSDQILEVKVFGFSGELKVSKIDDEADNKCYYNMFG